MKYDSKFGLQSSGTDQSKYVPPLMEIYQEPLQPSVCLKELSSDYRLSCNGWESQRAMAAVE